MGSLDQRQRSTRKRRALPLAELIDAEHRLPTTAADAEIVIGRITPFKTAGHLSRSCFVYFQEYV
jgi:hypothetical protein